jgi:polyisoprenoid-binding protein YceI
MKTSKLLVLSHAFALLLFSAAACGGKKDDKAGGGTGSSQKQPDPPKGSGSDTTKQAGSGSADTKQAGSGSGSADTKQAGSGSGSGDTMAGSGSGSAAPAEDPNADFIEVHAEHAKKKPDDPVKVRFAKWTVKKATFDPKKIEGGTATIEVDLTSLSTGSTQRDDHLKTKDYLDVAAPGLGTMTITVADVKKKGDDKHFTANATVKLHGAEKKLPVEFEVVDAKDDWIKVKGESKVKRSDFKIGKTTPDESVAEEMTFKLQLTLKKT